MGQRPGRSDQEPPCGAVAGSCGRVEELSFFRRQPDRKRLGAPLSGQCSHAIQNNLRRGVTKGDGASLILEYQDGVTSIEKHIPIWPLIGLSDGQEISVSQAPARPGPVFLSREAERQPPLAFRSGFRCL